MKIEYSPRAYSDLEEIYEYYRLDGDLSRAPAIEAHVQESVSRIMQFPHSGLQVHERSQVRVAFLLQERYKIFYTVLNDMIRIVHIRHMSRKPWTP